MLRADALQAIYSEVEDQIVVTIMGAAAAELYTLGHRSNFFYLEHAMGLASSMGLGIALAMPRHKVVVIDGDGSLLMNLGTLSTMARYRPGNLGILSSTMEACSPSAAFLQPLRLGPIWLVWRGPALFRR